MEKVRYVPQVKFRPGDYWWPVEDADGYCTLEEAETELDCADGFERAFMKRIIRRTITEEEVERP